jgi:hypothetical protein
MATCPPAVLAGVPEVPRSLGQYGLLFTVSLPVPFVPWTVLLSHRAGWVPIAPWWLQSPVWARALAVPCCESLLTPPFRHLLQCPRVNGVKAHTDKCNRRQVTLDLQIW